MEMVLNIFKMNTEGSCFFNNNIQHVGYYLKDTSFSTDFNHCKLDLEMPFCLFYPFFVIKDSFLKGIVIHFCYFKIFTRLLDNKLDIIISTQIYCQWQNINL